MRVLVTGAGGFIGRQLVADLVARDHWVRACSSASSGLFPGSVEVVAPSMRGPEIAWGRCVDDVDVVIHLAGRAHILQERSANPIDEFRRVNVRAAVELAKQARSAGVRQLIFVSSIGVNGSATHGRAFTEQDAPAPTEPYAISKWEAEVQLQDLIACSSMHMTIVRLPLVYGPFVRGNFLRLLRLVETGMPLPLGAIDNSRSYLGVANLCSFLACCMEHPAAIDELFLLADGQDLSTSRLICNIAAGLHRTARLYPCPLALLRFAARMAGKSAELNRLTGSLQVDGSKARRLLGWAPPSAVDDGIAVMTDWYLSHRQGQRGRLGGQIKWY